MRTIVNMVELANIFSIGMMLNTSGNTTRQKTRSIYTDILCVFTDISKLNFGKYTNFTTRKQQYITQITSFDFFVRHCAPFL